MRPYGSENEKYWYFFFQKFKKRRDVWLRGSNNQNLKEIRALGSEIIATRTDDGRTTDDGQISI